MIEASDELGAYRKLHHRNRQLQQEMEMLKSGDSGGTFPPMDGIDAKIAAAEARTETKFAELRGDLARFATKGTVWGAVGTALGIVLAVAALASNRFDAGMTTRSTFESIAAEQRLRDAEQDKKFDAILARLPAPAATPKN